MKNKNNKKTNLLTRILHDKKGIYVTTAMKIVIALVLGITILTGTTYVVKDVVMPQTEQKIVDAFDKDYSIGTLGQIGPSQTNDAGSLSVESLKEAHEFSYYSSLSQAVTAINSEDIITTPDATEEDGAVGVYKDGDFYSAVVLKDVEETTNVIFRKNTILNLGGKTINLSTSNAALSFATASTCTIDGRLLGSTIIKSPSESISSNSPIFMISPAGNFLMMGGNYVFDGNYDAPCLGIWTGSNPVSIENCNFDFSDMNDYSTRDFYAINGVDVTLKNTKIAIKTGIRRSVCGIAGYLTNLNVRDSVIDVKAGGSSCGIFANSCVATVNNSKISSASTKANSYGLRTGSGASVTVNGSELYAYADATSKCAIGVYNAAGGNLICSSSLLLADNSNQDYGSGIRNEGVATINGGKIVGVHSGLSTSRESKTYVNGGTFQSPHHGGIYFSHNASGEAYVENAILCCSNYTGKYDPAMLTDGKLGIVYVGGGSGADYQNISVYMNGCTLKCESDCNNSIVMRGTSGETGNKLYISNSTIPSNKKIRTDRDNKVIVGTGTNITSSMAHTPANILFTDETYVKN